MRPRAGHHDIDVDHDVDSYDPGPATAPRPPAAAPPAPPGPGPWVDQADDGGDDGQAALISAPMKVAPDSSEAYAEIERLRDVLVPQAEAAMPGTQILVTGQTANFADFFEMRDTYTPIVFLFVLGLSFLLLLIVFRSLVIAVKAILMNLLSVGAGYGLIVWVFQEGNLTGVLGFQQTDVIEAGLPLFMFAILFGLSMDYHVFVLSRIREHMDDGLPTRLAVERGIADTAGVVTSAAAVMVSVFAIFATLSMLEMKMMGVGLAAAILLDATLVRLVILPAAPIFLPNLAHAPRRPLHSPSPLRTAHSPCPRVHALPRAPRAPPGGPLIVIEVARWRGWSAA